MKQYQIKFTDKLGETEYRIYKAPDIERASRKARKVARKFGCFVNVVEHEF